MTEERNVPELPDLLAEIDGAITRLDTTTVPVDAMSEIKNTILPLMKDLTASVLYAMEDIQDMVEPVELTGAQAEETGALLTAFLESQGPAINPQLKERIELALEALGDDDGGDEDESAPEN